MGIPVNERLCPVSTLNFASLNAEDTGMSRGRNISTVSVVVKSSSRISFSPKSIFFISIWANAPGAIPKLITSANESSSLPISERAFSNLAANPSEKSNIIAVKIQRRAESTNPYARNKTEEAPDKRFRQVMKLGMCFFIMGYKKIHIQI